MGKRIILYILVFLLTLYCFFLYEDEIVTAMLVIEAVYFIMSSLHMKMLRHKLNVTMEPVIPVAEKNQEIPVLVSVKNNSRTPVVHFQIRLRVENLFTGEKQVYRTAGSVRKNSKSRVMITLKAKSCGNIQIKLERFWFYDGLFIFKDSARCKDTQKVGILPECHLIPVEVTRKTREFIADADEYSDQERGDDPSEIYQIREYGQGDSMHDIHWKLSAKADELLVKEHGRPLGPVVLIWLNLERAETVKKKQLPTVILEAAASLSMSLLEEKCVHMVAWYEPENKKVQKKRVSKEEHIYELLNRLLFAVPYEKQDKIQNIFEEAFRGEAFSTKVEFRLDGTVWMEEEEKMKLPLEEEKVMWNELFFTV